MDIYSYHEGEEILEGGEAPLLPTPPSLIDGLFSKGIKGGEAMIRRCSYHISLPSPLMKGRGIKG